MITLEQPKQGQFVAVWMGNNLLWSATFKYDDSGYLVRYAPDSDNETDEDEWVRVGSCIAIPPYTTLIAYHTM